eukprot:TRINITY_DN1350_c0_g2_i1.p1 TRINITY_DN1350_c0_g2~~TRINITY_DN1350_c0_g2_i1.p1  ORF type:complete len:881 (+),score=199.73 TRINITY_DN1350_c0_g2_i1:386-3028(+)
MEPSGEEELGRKEYNLVEFGEVGSLKYRMLFLDAASLEVSPWHGIPIRGSSGGLNFVCTSSRGSNARLSAAGEEPFTPLKHVKNHFTGEVARFLQAGCEHNYGFLPQTWSDVEHAETGNTALLGGCSPMEVIEIGSRVGQPGEVYEVVPLAAFALVGTDATAESEPTAWKIVAIDAQDALASDTHDVADLHEYFPGLLEDTSRWLQRTFCETSEGVHPYSMGIGGQPVDSETTITIIGHAHASWQLFVQENPPVERDPASQAPAAAVANPSQYYCDMWAHYTDEEPVRRESEPPPGRRVGEKWDEEKAWAAYEDQWDAECAAGAAGKQHASGSRPGQGPGAGSGTGSSRPRTAAGPPVRAKLLGMLPTASSVPSGSSCDPSATSAAGATPGRPAGFPTNLGKSQSFTLGERGAGKRAWLKKAIANLGGPPPSVPQARRSLSMRSVPEEELEGAGADGSGFTPADLAPGLPRSPQKAPPASLRSMLRWRSGSGSAGGSADIGASSSNVGDSGRSSKGSSSSTLLGGAGRGRFTIGRAGESNVLGSVNLGSVNWFKKGGGKPAVHFSEAPRLSRQSTSERVLVRMDTGGREEMPKLTRMDTTPAPFAHRMAAQEFANANLLKQELLRGLKNTAAGEGGSGAGGPEADIRRDVSFAGVPSIPSPQLPFLANDGAPRGDSASNGAEASGAGDSPSCLSPHDSAWQGHGQGQVPGQAGAGDAKDEGTGETDDSGARATAAGAAGIDGSVSGYSPLPLPGTPGRSRSRVNAPKHPTWSPSQPRVFKSVKGAGFGAKGASPPVVTEEEQQEQLRQLEQLEQQERQNQQRRREEKVSDDSAQQWVEEGFAGAARPPLPQQQHAGAGHPGGAGRPPSGHRRRNSSESFS